MTGWLRWLPAALVVAGLTLFLVAPGINGPLLVMGWVVVVGGYRFVAGVVPERLAKAAVDIAFLVLAFITAFEGGWTFIPAGLGYLAWDLFGGQSSGEPWIPGLESMMGTIAAFAGWIALAIVRSDRMAALLTDRADVVISIAGLLLGAILIASATHDRTHDRWVHGLLGLMVVSLAVVAVAGSITIVVYLLPALACAVTAWLAGRREPGQRSSPSTPSTRSSSP